LKKKYVFIGDLDSINLEIIVKSHKKLFKEIEYILIGDIFEIKNYLKKINSTLQINEILDPIRFNDYKIGNLNIFNIKSPFKRKYEKIIHQLKLSNNLSMNTGIDLVTMPINKDVIKKSINFNGITEYLGKINKADTFMLMYGEKFSAIPLTTHINPKEIHHQVNKKNIENNLFKIAKLIENKLYKLNIKQIKFLCYNPHCGENKTLGKEDFIIKRTLSKFKNIIGPIPSDSAFLNIEKNTLYISTYHDQALIPYKILNKKGFNLTLGLKYRRLSPSHGTARDIKFKNKAVILSYLACMNY
jgi:4-hydroxy-L-threonine phosphate dehydrogenase PdxA